MFAICRQALWYASRVFDIQLFLDVGTHVIDNITATGMVGMTIVQYSRIVEQSVKQAEKDTQLIMIMGYKPVYALQQ